MTEKSLLSMCPSERTVTYLIFLGKTNKEIAAETGKSMRTVTSTVHNAITKLGFCNRVQLAVWYALKYGNQRHEN